MSMGDNNSANITIADDGSVAIDGGLTVPVTDADGNTADTAVNVVTTTEPNYVPGENEIAINSTTGELLLGENVYKSVYADNAFSVTYEKSNFIKGDIDPTMYFNCVDNNTGIEYNKQSEDIEYIINFHRRLRLIQKLMKLSIYILEEMLMTLSMRYRMSLILMTRYQRLSLCRRKDSTAMRLHRRS